ncbi:DUF456 domain-containing protein [Pleurocapsales cyanobacterium LEGE 06147]|nr:DUF456 domain-containing protein [Pleurocapsales cyanobacterium LEGE 06147]
MDLTIVYWIVIAMMIVGIIGSVIPGIPGSILILAAIIIWGIATGFVGIGLPLITIFIVLFISTVIEYLGAYFGARQLGASKWSQLGAIAGMVLGFFGLLPALPFGGPILGALAGAIIGAFLGEFFYRSNLELNARLKQALKVSIGVFIGSIVGNIIEVFLAIIAVVIFVISTWPPVPLQ